MAWISVHEQLMNHRKVRELVGRLGCSRFEVLGILLSLWLWGVNNAGRDGSLGNAAAGDIASGILYCGNAKKLAGGLVGSGWLDKREGRYFLHDWDVWQEHWFKAIDKREKDTFRKRLERAAAHAACPPDSRADSRADGPRDVRASPSPSPNRHPTVTVTQPSDNRREASAHADSRGLPPAPCEEIVELYHGICPSLPRVTKLTDARKKKIRARWAEYPDLDTWRKIFGKAEASSFCKGGGERGWRAGLDFIVGSEANAVSLLEGKYDGRAGGSGPPAHAGYGDTRNKDYAKDRW